MVGKIMATRRCPCPNSQANKHVTLCGKRDFADVMKGTDLKKGKLLDFMCGPNLIARALAHREPSLLESEESRSGRRKSETPNKGCNC